MTTFAIIIDNRHVPQGVSKTRTFSQLTEAEAVQTLSGALLALNVFDPVGQARAAVRLAERFERNEPDLDFGPVIKSITVIKE